MDVLPVPSLPTYEGPLGQELANEPLSADEEGMIRIFAGMCQSFGMAIPWGVIKRRFGIGHNTKYNSFADVAVRLYPQEPTFILLGRDQYATATVEAWIAAMEAGMRGNLQLMESRTAIIAKAKETVENMKKWQEQNKDLVKLPD